MRPVSRLSELPEIVISLNKRFKVAVVMAEDKNTIEAVIAGILNGFLKPIFIGNKQLIISLIPDELLLNENAFDIVECEDPKEASDLAVDMVNNGEADILMKGLINTDIFLKSVLNKEKGLMKEEGVLSYVCALELPAYHKLLFITDPAVLPFPSKKQKIAMAQYAIDMTNKLGINEPKVALIGASEKVSEHFPNSLDYQEMKEMAAQGGFGKCIMDGPLDVFLACDPESLKTKKIISPIEGDADVLLFPSLEASNPFYKGLMLFGNGDLAGLIQGTTHPVVVMSRSESFKSKYYCLALACLMSN
ncbi:phosphate acyltransferase [Labilibacter marinus]|uniref:phosphate acyltransferase n=1 Tax=Labilibacter marinus TaxID=1477105 RepID=UPI00082FCCD3|nr:phosphate acyltransferase [Labilibacter marinus]